MRFHRANGLVLLGICAVAHLRGNAGGGAFFIVGAMGIRRGRQNGHLPPLEIGIWTKYAWKPEVNSLIPISIYLILAMTVYFPVWHSHCTRTKFTFLAAMSCLQSTHVSSFACRGRLRNLGTDCFTIGLHCVTTTWQQIFKGSLQVAAIGILSSVTAEQGRIQPVILGCDFSSTCQPSFKTASLLEEKWSILHHPAVAK